MSIREIGPYNRENMKTKVSIIIPIYNAMPYLTECLDSVSNQSYRHKEVLLINNGSTDNSLAVCREYEKRFDFVRTFNVESKSIGAARNYGLEKSSGDLIMFIDADDYLPGKDVLSMLVKKITASQTDICVGNYCRLWNGKLLHATSHRAFSRYPQNKLSFLFTGFFSVDVLSYVWAKLYRKDFIVGHGLSFSNSRYAEDKLFNLQAAAFGAKYSFLNNEIYVHRHNLLSVSNSYRHNPHYIWIQIAEELKDTFKDGTIPKIWKKMIAYTIFFGCFFDCKMEYYHHNRTLNKVNELLSKYGENPLCRESFILLSNVFNLHGIPSFMYKILIGGFAWAMRLHLYPLLALAIKLLVECKIDELLSDTGRKPK